RRATRARQFGRAAGRRVGPRDRHQHRDRQRAGRGDSIRRGARLRTQRRASGARHHAASGASRADAARSGAERRRVARGTAGGRYRTRSARHVARRARFGQRDGARALPARRYAPRARNGGAGWRACGGGGVIRVQVSAPSTALKVGLEAAVAGAPGLTLTEARADVVLTALPRDELMQAPAIVLVGDGGWSAALLRLGVRAILPHDATGAEIAASVTAAAAGLAAIDPSELESLLGEQAVQPVSEPGPLTAPQLQSLPLLPAG